MVKQLRLQAPFISSWSCSFSYQLNERVPASPGLGMNQVRRVLSLFTLGALICFQVRSHNIRIPAPITPLHDNPLIAMSNQPYKQVLGNQFLFVP